MDKGIGIAKENIFLLADRKLSNYCFWVPVNSMRWVKSCNSFLQHYWEHQIGMCKLKLWLYMLPYLYEDRCEHSGVKGWFKVALRADRAKQQLHGGIQVLVVLNLFSTLKVWTYTATGKISLKTSLEFSRWRIMRF